MKSLKKQVWDLKLGAIKQKRGEEAGGSEFTHSVSLLSSLQVNGMCGHSPPRASRSVESPPPHQPPAASAARGTQPSDTDETLAGLRR